MFRLLGRLREKYYPNEHTRHMNDLAKLDEKVMRRTSQLMETLGVTRSKAYAQAYAEHDAERLELYRRRFMRFAKCSYEAACRAYPGKGV